MRQRSTWLCTMALALGCSGEGDRSLLVLSQETPLPLDNALFYEATDDDHNRAVVADLESDRPRAVAYALPAGKVTSLVRPGSRRTEVVVLTAGTRARRDGDDIEAEVPAYALRFDRSGELSRHALGGRFDALTLSDDGQRGVAYAPQSGLAEDVAFVDFSAETDAVHNVGLRLLDGAAPSAFVFGPAAERRLVVALMPHSVSILDLAKLDVADADVVVPMSDANTSSDANRSPSQVLFHRDTVFVQSDGARDVLMLQLLPSGSEARGFTVAPLRLATTAVVADIAVIDQDANARVLAVGGGRVSLLLPLSGAGQELSVPTSLDQIVLFQGAAPADDQVRQRALLVGKGREIAFLDIGDEGTLDGEGLEVISAFANVVSVSSVAELGVAILVHQDRSFSVLDLAERTLSRLNAADAVGDVQLDLGPDHARLWYTLSAGSLGVIDLATRRPTELLFSRNVDAVVPLGGDSDWVAAVSKTGNGSAAVIDGDALAKGPLRELHGFTWSGLLDRGAP